MHIFTIAIYVWWWCKQNITWLANLVIFMDLALQKNLFLKTRQDIYLEHGGHLRDTKDATITTQWNMEQLKCIQVLRLSFCIAVKYACTSIHTIDTTPTRICKSCIHNNNNDNNNNCNVGICSIQASSPANLAFIQSLQEDQKGYKRVFCPIREVQLVLLVPWCCSGVLVLNMKVENLIKSSSSLQHLVHTGYFLSCTIQNRLFPYASIIISPTLRFPPSTFTYNNASMGYTP